MFHDTSKRPYHKPRSGHEIPAVWLGLLSYDMGPAMLKHDFAHLQTVKAQIIEQLHRLIELRFSKLLERLVMKYPLIRTHFKDQQRTS